MPSEELSTYEQDVNEFFTRLRPDDFEAAHCLFCGQNPKSQVLFKTKTIEISRCSCGFVYNSRQPKLYKLNEFYQRSSAINVWAKLKTSQSELERQQRKFGQAALWLANSKAKSVLDVGCGNGVFLRGLKELNHKIEVCGIDQSAAAIQECHNQDIPAHNQSIVDFFQDNKKEWDAITLWGCLEHLKDPVAQLRLIAKKISVNGVLVVCVPNVASRVVRMLWDKCFTFCPQHLWYFDGHTLVRLLDEVGFSIVRRQTIEPESLPIMKYTHGFQPYQDLPAWAESRYTPQPLVEHYDKTILDANEGYKLVYIARKR